jgi:hypothetical protein
MVCGLVSAVADSIENAEGQLFHIDCFKCKHCGKFLSSEPHKLRENELYCSTHYIELFAPRCFKCSGVILKDGVETLGHHWHPECFGCFECGVAFPEGKFLQHEGKAFCVMHYRLAAGLISPEDAAQEEELKLYEERVAKLLEKKKNKGKEEPVLKEVYSLQELHQKEALHPSIDMANREVRDSNRSPNIIAIAL